MARDIERVELLFRRQIALHPTKAPRRDTIQQIDGVSRKREVVRLPPLSPVQRACGASERPKIALIPSAGYFNAARLPAVAPAWMFIIAETSRSALDELITTICSAQSSRRAFRPLFVLGEADHIEPMRQYGFTFEFICPDAYLGWSRAEQIEMLKAKWGIQLCLEIKGSNHAALRAATGSADPPQQTTTPALGHLAARKKRLIANGA